MSEVLCIVLPWVLSVLGIYAAWQIGNKKPWVFKLKVFNQIIWIVWACISENWGFLPMAVVFTFIYLRNHYRWNESDEKTS